MIIKKYSNKVFFFLCVEEILKIIIKDEELIRLY